MLNHTLMDGVSMYTNIMSRLFYEYQSIDYIKKYEYIPGITEIQSLQTIAYHATNMTIDKLTNNTRLHHNINGRAIIHYLKIRNSLLKQIKQQCGFKISFNVVLLVYICKYIFDNCKYKRNSLNIAIVYGFECETRNNNYTFIHICVKNNTNIISILSDVNQQITSNMYQIHGHYNLIHNTIKSENIIKTQLCDIMFSSIITKNLADNSSIFVYCHNPTIPIYIACQNALGSEYSSICLNILSNDVNICNNSYTSPYTIDE